MLQIFLQVLGLLHTCSNVRMRDLGLPPLSFFCAPILQEWRFDITPFLVPPVLAVFLFGVVLILIEHDSEWGFRTPMLFSKILLRLVVVNKCIALCFSTIVNRYPYVLVGDQAVSMSWDDVFWVVTLAVSLAYGLVCPVIAWWRLPRTPPPPPVTTLVAPPPPAAVVPDFILDRHLEQLHQIIASCCADEGCGIRLNISESVALHLHLISECKQGSTLTWLKFMSKINEITPAQDRPLIRYKTDQLVMIMQFATQTGFLWGPIF